MTGPTPMVDPYALAQRLGVDIPDDRLIEAIEVAIADAEADVEGYLGRPIQPVTRTATGRWPSPWGWGLPDAEPVLRIVSTTPEFFADGVTSTGTFTVVYEVGLDYRNDPALRPIRRYVIAAALNSAELLLHVTRLTNLRGQVQSVSVSTEGQSKNVTYAPLALGGGGQPAADAPGALPSLKTLDRWRLAGRRIHQAPDLPTDQRTGNNGGRTRDADGFWNTYP